MPKILIIRLSSIGDIIQCLGVIGGIRLQYPTAEIHWVARADMAQTLSIYKDIDKVWYINKEDKLKGLIEVSKQLRAEKYDYIYDAHNNIRSCIIKTIIHTNIFHYPNFAVRSKQRFKRLLLFKYRINLFDWPFISMESFRKPLRKWNITKFVDNPEDYHFSEDISSKFQGIINEKTVTLVPSANWVMKRWPVSHWCSLVKLLPDHNFVILGGPLDDFCQEIKAVAPERVVNMSGCSSIIESCYIVSQSNVVVSGDTGFMHSADLFMVPTIALIGPTAFGFPSRKSSEILEIDLDCRPCTKDGSGECTDAIYQHCMVGITPQRVAQRVANILPVSSESR